MNPKTRRRKRVRTAEDVEVLQRALLDPRGVCIRCYDIIGPKAVWCDKCRPGTDSAPKGKDAKQPHEGE